MDDDRDLRAYGLGLIAEKAGELTTEIGRGLRFGFDSPTAPENKTGSQVRAIHKEAADVMAAIDWAVAAGILDGGLLDVLASAKFNKLVNPKNKDHLGRPLAPALPPPACG